MPNRLTDETSPYLLQHANNPVDWYAWGPEALERARSEDRPILLSVGYSACHWCHVMERESFEDVATAEMMNAGFVCIKVDREERPDVDSIYMTAVQAMTGSGGWPMTVFLTPEGEPFYGGTYFPPEDRGGLPAFPRVLEAMASVYRDSRGDVARTARRLVERMRAVSSLGGPSQDPLTADVLSQAFRGMAEQFDHRSGGMGLQPKFPQPMVYEFLLRYYLRTGEPQAREMVELTLDRMAAGGIYDQIGGGFHRYSTDAYWLVPHFEKMLYDNALLARLYLHAYQVTGKPAYRRVVEEILEYILREMTGVEGGFYSAQDADSEGVEGKYFVWRPEEIVEVLGEEDGAAVNGYFGVTPEGHFEGRSILHLASDPREEADGSPDEATLRRAKEKLLEARADRVPPGRDDKVLTAWNGLTLGAFAEAAAVLRRPDYAAVAARNADFILSTLKESGRLLRTFKDGRAKLNGYLEDYAFLISGLLALHEVSVEARWLREAITLGREMVALFWDEGAGHFYDTGQDHEELILRPRDVADNAVPSGSSAATEVLLRLAVITGDPEYERRAAVALRSARELIGRFPNGAGNWACALDFYLSTVKEVAIVGTPDDPETEAMIYEVFRRYIPNRVLVGGDVGDPVTDVPLLESRDRLNGRTTAYLCRNYVCQLPVAEPEELARQLA